MSKVIQNRGGIGMGAPYDIPGYEYDPVTDKFKDLATGTIFDKDGNAKLEDSKSVSITSNGEYQINPSATYDAMKKVALSVEVQAADLEDNKAATIDVSAYTDPVEITPTEGKDGMKKVTVSLSNIPAGANMLYAWVATDMLISYFSFNTAPATKSDFEQNNSVMYADNTGIAKEGNFSVEAYTKVSDTEIEVTFVGDDSPTTLTRDSTKDIEVWNAPPEVETTKQATIDVSTYDPANKPVITPTAGKQSMGSVEVTLSNIPSGGAVLYPWKVNNSQKKLYLNIDTAPATSDGIKELVYDPDVSVEDLIGEGDTYIKVSDTEFTISYEDDGQTIILTWTRDVSSPNVTVWS